MRKHHATLERVAVARGLGRRAPSCKLRAAPISAVETAIARLRGRCRIEPSRSCLSASARLSVHRGRARIAHLSTLCGHGAVLRVDGNWIAHSPSSRAHDLPYSTASGSCSRPMNAKMRSSSRLGLRHQVFVRDVQQRNGAIPQERRHGRHVTFEDWIERMRGCASRHRRSCSHRS